jgi:hypothetical protein
VNEADTRIFLARDPAEVLLAIENSTGKTMPDRVVVYLWLSGVVKFNFKFRPRFGLNAKMAASVVYDYYNPEARAVVEPATFRIK